MLNVHGLSCVRGLNPLFENLEFQMSWGDCLWIKGPNGIGKTSLIRILSGLSHPESGEVIWNNVPVDDDPDLFQQSQLCLLHHDGLDPRLSVYENLKYGYPGLAPHEIDENLSCFQMDHLKFSQIKQLSAGQRKKAALCRFVHRFPLWIMDEPMTHLDQYAKDALCHLITKHCQNRGMVIVVSHVDGHVPANMILDMGVSTCAQS